MLVNVPLWHLGEQVQKSQTDKPNDYTTPVAAHVPRAIITAIII